MTTKTPEALAVLDAEIAFRQGNANRERARGNENKALQFESRIGGMRKARAAFAAEHEALKEMRDLFDLMCGLGFNPAEGHEGSPKANADAALAAVEVLK